MFLLEFANIFLLIVVVFLSLKKEISDKPILFHISWILIFASPYLNIYSVQFE